MLRAGFVLGILAACNGPTPTHRAGPDPLAVSSEAYDRMRRPDELVAALGVSPGARVADVGAGTGYLTFRLARAVGPAGLVVATDIDRSALAALAAAAGSAPIRVRAVAPDDPGLEPGGYDLVLLAEVDHLLPDRAAYLRRLAASLAPGGRIAVSNRGYRKGGLARDAARAGLRLSEAPALPSDPFLVFLETP